MGSVKQKYIAKVGLNFNREGKTELRVEPGHVLPENISEADIKSLLEIRAIEVKGEKKGADK